MTNIYLNPDMLYHINSTVQYYITEWFKQQQLQFENDPRNSNYIYRIVQYFSESSTTTLILTFVSLIFFYKWLFNQFTPNGKIKPARFTIPIPDAVRPNWKSKRLLNPSITIEQDSTIIQSYCPATGQLLGQFKSMTKSQLDEQIEQAERAQIEFGNSSMDRRFKILLTLHDFIINNQDLITKIACRDSGKTKLDASMGEILVTLEKISWLLKHSSRILSPSKRSGPTNFFMKWYKKAEIRYEPLGVVAGIVSWNYPFHNLLGPIIDSIVTGNAIIMKCSEQVVWSSEIFIDLVKKALIACDEEPNLVQLFYCLPPSPNSNDDTANYFTSRPQFKSLTFIGSQPIAKQILKCTADPITPVVVELGGKDSLIVLDSFASSDLQSLSSIIMRGTFQSSGQNCIGIERIIVSAKHYEKLTQILSDRITFFPLRQGSDIDSQSSSSSSSSRPNPLDIIDMGAMISNNRFKQLEELVQDAVSKGAKLIYGGTPYVHPNYPQGHYFKPTLLIDVTPEMNIAQQEVFGPIMCVMKARDTNDCVSLANSAPFGLGGSVFGKDLDECNYVANQLKTGNVAINDFATFYVCQLPFGGIHGSGYGKFGGEEGLLRLCNAKSVCYDRFSFIKTQIPPPLDYPIKNDKKSWNFVKSFITGSYTTSKWQLIKSLLSLAKESK
ncbi:meiotic recombination directing protein NDAI_0C02140 [Naumovozyma dairenensis CBS 421]|uniref:Aldehyde dehydrogenase domain-containing protein n=1 Tax=Naumovozyma dairenensis (strain ATCC 10597 / BCRC 20456 / CBS 421 / NBRC 0211 / NRRL Y-12639) TaxID=1071378 RepID=G0W7W3_NAUDC|nr:hypothetical protein NDAI_0C02140 [Naumovozyma dairenensis CBS 421]CCD23874.1 hypothetical protein NDAI_0C02140 [Naumovozyma dairenensis CBS 421]